MLKSSSGEYWGNPWKESKPITDLEVLATIIKHILLGLKHMHENGYLHRDIKADNILVNDKGIIKLCDFGIANKLFDDNHKKIFRSRKNF